MKLIALHAQSALASGSFTSGNAADGAALNASADEANNPAVLALPNDADASQTNLAGIERVDLHFPKFTDGRAYSQAVVLRRRCGFKGEIRATGDVLLDQVLLMQRSGFSSAQLRDDQDATHASVLLSQFAGFYQGDALQAQPHFARGDAAAKTATATSAATAAMTGSPS